MCVQVGACESLLTGRGLSGGGVVYYCCKWVARIVSKIALGKMFWLSFKWLLAVYSALM